MCFCTMLAYAGAEALEFPQSIGVETMRYLYTIANHNGMRIGRRLSVTLASLVPPSPFFAGMP